MDDNYIATDTTAQEAAERITNAEDFDAERPLVLIIDDNNGMRAYLRSILQDKYNVSEATNGEQGLEKARREVPKLVVCDVMMPVMDGLEFTKRLKEDTATSHIPVVLLTARSLSEQRKEGFSTSIGVIHIAMMTGILIAHEKFAHNAALGVCRRQAGDGGRGEAERGGQDVRWQTAHSDTRKPRRQRLLGGATGRRDRAFARAAI